MQPNSGNGAITTMQAAFTEKYDEPISTEILTQLTIKYGNEAVTRVIEQMKPDAYEAADYLEKCLSSGWYQSLKVPSSQEKGSAGKPGMSKAAVETLRFTWSYRVERGWISWEEQDYMLGVFLNETAPNEEKTRDINFRCLQGMYPDIPAAWFYWLPLRERRITANTWIAKSEREDLQPYEIT